MAQLQASSRFVFALARDNALPFSETIRWTNSEKQPIIANWAVVIICMPFACLLISGQGTLYSVLAVTSSTLSYVGYVSVLGRFFHAC
jgi:amino acid transporter